VLFYPPGPNVAYRGTQCGAQNAEQHLLATANYGPLHAALI